MRIKNILIFSLCGALALLCLNCSRNNSTDDIVGNQGESGQAINSVKINFVKINSVKINLVELFPADESSTCFLDSSQECSAILPLYLKGGPEDPSLRAHTTVPIIFGFDHSKMKELFSQDATLTYQIIEGNPTYTLEKEKSAKNFQEFYPLRAYRIDNEGKLYIRDPWLLGRNSSLYGDKSEQSTFFNRGRANHPKRFQRACGMSSCPDGQEYTVHSYHGEYTLGRTQNDNLVIRIQEAGDPTSYRDIALQMKANPHSVDLVQKCTQSNALEKWICRHTKEIVPNANLTTTQAHTASLPDDLFYSDKSQYELVVNLEFDSLEETKKYLNFRYDDPKYTEVKDGKLFLHNPIIRKPDGSSCRLDGARAGVGTRGKFELGYGYLEYDIARYPNLGSSGGNILMWSRFGVNHSAFAQDPPSRILDLARQRSGAPSELSRSMLGYIGFGEINMIERWDSGQLHSWFVTFAHPLEKRFHINGVRYTLDPHSYGYTTLPGFPFSADVRDSAMPPTQAALWHSAVIGLEISPNGLQIYKDGKAMFSAPRLKGFFGGAAMRIYAHGLHDTVDCAGLRDDEDIVFEYIRFYQPKERYIFN